MVSSRMVIKEGTSTTAEIAPRNCPLELRRGTIIVIAKVPPDFSLTCASRILALGEGACLLKPEMLALIERHARRICCRDNLSTRVGDANPSIGRVGIRQFAEIGCQRLGVLTLSHRSSGEQLDVAISLQDNHVQFTGGIRGGLYQTLAAGLD